VGFVTNNSFEIFNMKKCKYLSIFFVAAIFSIAIKAQMLIPNITDPRLDFTLTTLKGDSVSLSSLKGKVLLIDFWASWCVPCRYANRSLVKLYSKYKDKGFEILGVSVDEEVKDWEKAIRKDKITWPQVNDTGGWDAIAAIKWRVEALPSSFLIDKEGNLVAIDLDKKDLEKKIIELLGL
jgi:thiol-disulfide isomerase/thioredoxin